MILPSPFASGLQVFLGIINKGLQAWNDYWARKQRQDDRNIGALEQREKSRADQDKTLADDRVRVGNSDLQQRVQHDHGIEVGSDP